MKSYFKFLLLFSFMYRINDLKKSKKFNVKIVIKIFFKFFQIWKHFSFKFKICSFFIEIIIDLSVLDKFLTLVQFVHCNQKLFFTKLFLKFKIFSFNRIFFLNVSNYEFLIIIKKINSCFQFMKRFKNFSFFMILIFFSECLFLV